MNYQEASKIRKTGLLSLIAEKKFEEGRGLGSSIGGAISEKFKAKSVGFKEKLDPLNMLSKVVGKGVLGKSITTIAGRAFGRDEDTIRYFGGYSKKKQIKKKDPLLSTVGPGVVTNVKVGDSVTDVMAKMYNFMEKTYEIKKRNDELEQAFRKEQLDEDERRHQKVIDAIFGRKVKPEEKEEEDKSWLEKMVQGLKDALSPIMSIIGSMLSAIGPLLSSLGGLVTSIAGPLLSILMGPIEMMIKGFFKRFVYEIIGKLGAQGAVALLGTTMSTIVLGGLAAVLGGAGVVEYNEYMTGVKEGPEAQKIDSDIGQIENEYSSIQNPADPRLQERNQRIEEKQKERKTAVENYQNQKLIPLMQEDGWSAEKDEEGKLIFKKNQTIATNTDIAAVVEKNSVKESFEKAIKDNPAMQKIQKNIDEAVEKSKELLPTKDKTLIPESSVEVRSIPPLTSGDVDADKSLIPGETIILDNKSQTIPGAPPKMMNTSSTEIRNRDLNRYLRNSTATV